MGWGCYANFEETKVSIYLPRKSVSEAKDFIQELSELLDTLEGLDLSGVDATESTLTLSQAANIVKCAEYVDMLFSSCSYPQYLIAASLYRLDKTLTVANEHVTGYIVISQ